MLFETINRWNDFAYKMRASEVDLLTDNNLKVDRPMAEVKY